MKIILAPNAYKESLTASEAARAMRRGLKRALPEAELIEMPIADGGDGTIEVMRRTTGGARTRLAVTGPLGEPVKADILRLAGQKKPTDVIEMAQTSGLKLVPPAKRNPMKTTTAGLGEAIAFSIRRGAERIVIGIGGSATNDAGAGMAQAMGFELLDRRGRPIPPGGGGLERLDRIVPPCGWREGSILGRPIPEIITASDVTNRLLGPRGASAVFGPQKGATPAMIKRLDAALARLALRWEKDLGRRMRSLAGGGSAGGLGAGLAAFLGAKIQPGAQFILDIAGFRPALRGADWVITGEGRLDLQTLGDKAPAVVARLAREAGVPTIGLAGEIGGDLIAQPGKARRLGLRGCFSIAPGPITLADCQSQAAALVENAAFQIGCLLRGRKSGRSAL